MQETQETFRRNVLAALTNPRILTVDQLLLDGMYERGRAAQEAAADIDHNVGHYEDQHLVTMASWDVVFIAGFINTQHQWTGSVPPLHDLTSMDDADVAKLRAIHATTDSTQEDFGAATALHVRWCQSKRDSHV